MIFFNHTRGFTLIELLIVVAIIAILAAIAVPNFLEAQTRSKVSRVMSDMANINLALESYSVDNNHYPPCWNRTANWWINLYTDRLKPCTTPIAYITKVPPDVFVSDKSQGVFFSGHPWNPDAYMAIQYSEDFYIPASVRDDVSSPDYPGWGYVTPQGVNVGWKLESVGPDRKYTFQQPWDPDYETIEYDPTNGTVSYGDVRRYGGADRGNINY
ncbi:prepilin-type N-terminal cleavage/methylation domain-containing protein [Candidatus Sumerlaeota bacterium]|nr:prepilin-type N-terminal cleavage/methylation domain-containing protein [Candidatus Sumerlaeota bacterium]